MWTGPFKFFPNHLTKDTLVQRFFRFLEKLAQSLVDHGLIPVSGPVCPGTKFFEDVRVEVNGDSSFPLLRNHLAPFRVFEIIFLNLPKAPPERSSKLTVFSYRAQVQGSSGQFF